jgi:DNA invertase Pin-like site-specific DNA recombinase
MMVFVYLRVSTGKQAESGAGISAQQEACRQWVDKRGMCIEKIFIEEGVSGTTSFEKRLVLVQAISHLNRGDVLLVAKRDRLGRDIRKLAKIEDEVFLRGARVVSAAGEGTEGNEANDIFMRGIFDLVSQHERNIIIDRTKEAMRCKKERGERVGHIPFGYRLGYDGIHIEEDEYEKGVLREIKKLRIIGMSTRKIAEEMNKRGALNRGKSKWNHASMHRAVKKINSSKFSAPKKEKGD